MSKPSSFDAKLQSWLANIVEDTQDLFQWLLFADWLEEQGHPQAAVTRLWASQRWKSEEWTADNQRELQALLDQGLRPFLPRHVNSLGMEFVLVPRGTFWMSENGKNAQKQMTIEHDFYMGIYPVTQGQWQEVMMDNPSYFSRTGFGNEVVENIPNTDLRNFPVESVSWYHIQEFLTRLNVKENASNLLTYRLPTETEWEYACREGATSKEDCSFEFYLAERFHHLSSTQANFNGKYLNNLSREPYLQRTTSVDAYQPNRLGIFDMHGNVWELTQTVRTHEGEMEDWNGDCYWHEDSDKHMLADSAARGGCWNAYVRSCGAAIFCWFSLVSRYEAAGFRVVAVRGEK